MYSIALIISYPFLIVTTGLLWIYVYNMYIYASMTCILKSWPQKRSSVQLDFHHASSRQPLISIMHLQGNLPSIFSWKLATKVKVINMTNSIPIAQSSMFSQCELSSASGNGCGVENSSAWVQFAVICLHLLVVTNSTFEKHPNPHTNHCSITSSSPSLNLDVTRGNPHSTHYCE